MRDVRVNKADLLKIVQSNRNNHRKIFQEAQEGFKKEVIKQLEMRLTDAKNGKRINGSFHLEAPIDQTREYDRVISMLNMSVDDIVELDEESYAQYVLDQWAWRHSFLMSNSAYSGTAAAQLEQ